jgi:hypothetical protein
MAFLFWCPVLTLEDVRYNEKDGLEHEKGDDEEESAHCAVLLLHLDQAERVHGDIAI